MPLKRPPKKDEKEDKDKEKNLPPWLRKGKKK